MIPSMRALVPKYLHARGFAPTGAGPLFPFPAAPGAAHALPTRVSELIREHDERSERLIGWAQLGLVLILSALYIIAPRPADAPPRMLGDPVPVVLSVYFVFTAIRLVLAYRGRLPGWLLLTSIVADVGLLLWLIWSFHDNYGQPPAFSLKVPTFVYFFAIIAMRALRFDYRYLLAAGIAAAVGWAGLVALAIAESDDGTITRNFVSYISDNRILIGAEFDKIVTLLMVTVLLAVAIRRAQGTLQFAFRAETAARDIRRFVSGDVAEVITRSDREIEAGEASERDAAILMLDIRGFTGLSATLPPKAVVEMLTQFHARVLPVIREHGGIVDKFLGDGVMATFGAVDPSATAAADAVRALDIIMREAADLRETSTGAVESRLNVNGAVAAGTVVFTTLGNGDRLEYTVIGEAVNLAAKLEKHNKTLCTRALVPDETYRMAISQGYAPPRPHTRQPQCVIAGVSKPLDLVTLAD